VSAQNRFLFTARMQKNSLLFGLIFALIARFPYESAEDILNARENIRNGNRTDFWGAFSSWFFTRVNGNFWEETYALAFGLIILIGAHLLLKSLTDFSELKIKAFLPFSLIYYCSLIFALDFSRDGSLLSFSWLGCGLFCHSQTLRNKIAQRVALTGSILSFLLALLFRPWMAAVFVIFIIIFNLYFGSARASRLSLKGTCVASLFILVMPISTDLATSSLLSLNRSYPEQQVVIMDLASIACLSSNPNVSGEALEALSPIIEGSPVRKTVVCSQFYPSSVGSVLFYPENWGNVASAVRLIGVNEQTTYETIRKSWVSLLTSHPKDYIQIKVLLGSQWLLAGDSNLWRGSPLQIFLVSPLSIARELRLFSGLFVLAFLIGLAICNRRKSIYLGLLTFYLSSLTLLTIAFTGDNHRYLLPFSIMSFLVVVCERITLESEVKARLNSA